MSAQFTRRYALTLLGGALGALAGCQRTRSDSIVIGSKNFTEQIILAELLAQQVEAHTSLRDGLAQTVAWYREHAATHASR